MGGQGDTGRDRMYRRYRSEKGKGRIVLRGQGR